MYQSKVKFPSATGDRSSSYIAGLQAVRDVLGVPANTVLQPIPRNANSYVQDYKISVLTEDRVLRS